VAFRRLALGAFACTMLVIVLLVGKAVLSAAGLSADPHGYTMIFGLVSAAVLTPVAYVLWLLFRWL
jgi:hypothetical protein